MDKLKKVIYKQFKKYGVTVDVIAKSVWEGDPHGWSSKAFATISTEHGIPSAGYEPGFTEWDMLNCKLHSLHLYAEPVNGAIVAIYKV